MYIKCGDYTTTTVIFSNAQSVILCNNCKNILCKPTDGKCKLK
jgi:ribosomal protein S27E